MCWSDSKVVLYWLHGKANKPKRFVENRVRQITSLVETKNWNYCPSQKNPADIVSRGASISQLVNNRLWWDGPEFLKYEQSNWPKFELLVESPKDSFEPDMVANTFLFTTTPVIELNSIIPCENYSCFINLFELRPWY